MPKNQKTPPLAVNAEKSIGQEFHDLLVATDIPIKTYTALNRTREKFLAGKHISTKSEIACTQSMLETINQIPILRNAVEQDPNSKLYALVFNSSENIILKSAMILEPSLESASGANNVSMPHHSPGEANLHKPPIAPHTSSNTPKNKWKYLSPFLIGFLFLAFSFLFSRLYDYGQVSYQVDDLVMWIGAVTCFLFGGVFIFFAFIFYFSILLLGDAFLNSFRMIVGLIIVLALGSTAVYMDIFVGSHPTYLLLITFTLFFIVFWFFAPYRLWRVSRK